MCDTNNSPYQFLKPIDDLNLSGSALRSFSYLQNKANASKEIVKGFSGKKVILLFPDKRPAMYYNLGEVESDWNWE